MENIWSLRPGGRTASRSRRCLSRLVRHNLSCLRIPFDSRQWRGWERALSHEMDACWCCSSAAMRGSGSLASGILATERSGRSPKTIPEICFFLRGRTMGGSSSPLTGIRVPSGAINRRTRLRSAVQTNGKRPPSRVTPGPAVRPAKNSTRPRGT